MFRRTGRMLLGTFVASTMLLWLTTCTRISLLTPATGIDLDAAMETSATLRDLIAVLVWPAVLSGAGLFVWCVAWALRFAFGPDPGRLARDVPRARSHPPKLSRDRSTADRAVATTLIVIAAFAGSYFLASLPWDFGARERPMAG